MLVASFSTGRKFCPVSIFYLFFYIVKRSYSSHPFLCALATAYDVILEVTRELQFTV